MDNNKGKGWFGDSKGHADAGRKGGKASSNSRKRSLREDGRENNNSSENDRNS